jgi:predicted house-cleaning noncanonical NTP pyrophosphatase (MazG superfamily)
MGFKIVRDYVEGWAREHGVSGVWRPCMTPVASLEKKLFEEAGEYTERCKPDELYDLRDVLDRLISIVDTNGQAAARHAIKVSRLGMFDRLIEWSPVPEEHQQEEMNANGIPE